MADNVTLPGTGVNIASKDIGGIEYQKMLISDGTTPTQTLAVDSNGRATVNVNGTVPVSLSGVAQDSSLSTINTSIGATNTALATLNTSVGAGNTSAAATATGIGAPADAVASTDTGTFSALAFLKRLCQSLTSLIAKFPAALGAGGGLKVDGSGTALPVSGTFWQATQPVSGSVSLAPVTSGGLSPYRNLSLLVAGASVKASAGQLYGYYLENNAASARYVKFYDKASAPVVASDTPVLTLPLPAGAAANLTLPIGLVFATGIAICATGGVGDTDSTAPSANDVVVNLFYK